MKFDGASVSTGGKVCSQRLVEECHLFGCRYLEYLQPSGQCISFYGWPLQTPALNPLEEDIRRRREVMQLNGGAKGSGAEPQGIPLGPSPGAPFDDYCKTEGARSLLSSALASVVLPEAGNPHTMINLGPVADLSIGRLSPINGLLVPEFSRRKGRPLAES